MSAGPRRLGGWADRPQRTGDVSAQRESPLRYLPRLLVTLARAHPLAASVLIVFTVVGGALPALELWVLGRLVDALAGVLGAGAAGWSALLPWVLVMASALALEALLQLVSPILEASLRERLGIRLQRDVIEKAQSLELAYFEHPEFHDLLQRANQDMSGRLVNLLRLLFDILGAAVGIAGFLVLLVSAHWSLIPIVVLGSAPGFWVMMQMNKRTYWVYRIRTPENRRAIYLGGLLTRRDEAKEVRLFTLSRHLLHSWLELVRKLAVERRGLEVKQANLGALTGGVASAAYAACLTILAYLVLGSRLTVGDFVAVTRTVQLMAMRIEQVMRTAASLHEQSLYLGDLYEFLSIEQPERPTQQKTEVALDEPLGEIRFEKVSFKYPGSDRYVLHDVDLTIRPGERIALVGENGAGKSTLVRLLLGLYEPSEGRILLGGRDLQTLPDEYVRHHMASVFQDFVRYRFTVHENIAFGQVGAAGPERVAVAAQMAGIADDVERLPDGYRTQLGRELGGLDLSGGQWQKLAIARALVRETDLIVLDEPTASLDPKAEADVYRHFYEMTRGRTALLISHRLGSARMAHRIVVLKDGRVVEEGDHNELVRQDGEYGRLFRLQAQWYE